MLTIKVITEWIGSPQAAPPDLSGPVRPAEHVFEANSVYNDAGRIMIYGVPDYEKDGEKGSVTYESVLYDAPWSQTIYVMNASGATISKYMIGSYGGDIGCPSRIAPNAWHPVPEPEFGSGDIPEEDSYDASNRERQTQPDKVEVAAGA